MPDYHHPLLFGTFVTPAAAHADRVVQLARLTEDVGLDVFTVQDHPYQPSHLDAWTLLSVVAARTSTLRVMPNVLNLPLRPPAVLAGSAASLDIISGGRVELALGAGGFREAVAAMGGPRRTAAESVQALEEAVRIIRALWSVDDRGIRIEGEHYQVHGVHPGPAPAHDISIALGALKDRMLRLTGRLADGWLPSSSYVAPDALARSNAIIDEAAVAAGRAPQDIRRMYNIFGSFERRGTGFLTGPATMWAEQLGELALTEGMSEFIVVGDDPDLVREFAEDVVPAVRELVAAERNIERAAPGTSGAGSEELETVAPRVRSSSPSASPSPDPAGAARPTASSEVLRAVPTPDDGVRLTDGGHWDESTRPTGPVPDPGRSYTEAQIAAGSHLVEVHDRLRAELAELRDLAGQVAGGAVTPGDARSHINTMTMRQNNWTLGTYCESYCRVLTIHHEIEDTAMFPRLRRADPQLKPVIGRLEEEHRGIHAMLEQVDAALVALVGGADGIGRLQHAIDVLSDGLLSHLSYEERELVEPLARTS